MPPKRYLVKVPSTQSESATKSEHPPSEYGTATVLASGTVAGSRKVKREQRDESEENESDDEEDAEVVAPQAGLAESIGDGDEEKNVERLRILARVRENLLKEEKAKKYLAKKSREKRLCLEALRELGIPNGELTVGDLVCREHHKQSGGKKALTGRNLSSILYERLTDYSQAKELSEFILNHSLRLKPPVHYVTVEFVEIARKKDEARQLYGGGGGGNPSAQASTPNQSNVTEDDLEKTEEWVADGEDEDVDNADS